ncbi:MAG TPA: FAD-dependent monooxygenase, partial [Polyangiaceae bacterium]|nr:FAD-dependent monooxygenase [Polyangiaceae bacterium]
ALRRRGTNGAVLLLHPGSLALLHRHGVANAVVDRGWRVRSIRVYRDAECVGELSLEKVARRSRLPFDFGISVAQADLEDCLRDALRARHVEVHDQRRLTRFEQGAARVRVTIDHLDTDSAGYAVAHSEMVVDKSEDIEPEFVLAADGHQSAMRQQLGLEFGEIGATQPFLVVEGRAPSPAPEVAVLSFDAGRSSSLWPLVGGRQHAVFGVQSADLEALGLHDAHHHPGARLRIDAERLSAWVAARTRWQASGWNELEARGPFHADPRLASGFGRGRVWLAGAAAHWASPLTSLSTNVGLSEAAQLADIFAAAKGRETPLDALASYERESLERWRRLLDADPVRLDPFPPSAAGGAMAASEPAARDFDALLAGLTSTRQSAA